MITLNNFFASPKHKLKLKLKNVLKIIHRLSRLVLRTESTSAAHTQREEF